MTRLTSSIVVIVSLAFTLSLGMLARADVNLQSPLSSTSVQVQETSLGDLVADAVREGVRAPIAFVPAGSFKEISLPKGSTDSADIMKCLQYPDDKIAILRLTGDQVLQALERSISINPQKNMGFLQVSGLTFKFDSSAARGSRVSDVEVGKQKLDASRVYDVAMPAPFADGAYGYFTVWGKQKPMASSNTMSKAVTDFLNSKTSIDYADNSRITSK